MAFEPIQTLVRRSIERYPDRVAVECPQGPLTYAELDARADAVAAALQAAGAGVGSPVPVLAQDRREIVAALVGILRIGGVFVPLDLDAPRVRLEQLLEELGPQWLLAGSRTDAQTEEVIAGAAPSAIRICMDTIEAGPYLPHPPGPDDPCYIFYTSGTTGAPKGIVGRLQAIDHYIRWECDLLGIAPGSGWRVSQLTSPSFDAMLRDVFVPLATGGTVCVPPKSAIFDGTLLDRWIDEARINLVHCVPSLFRGLLRDGDGHTGEFAELRCVALSGERLPPRDVARWFDRFGERIPLVNLYGPSETTMTKTYHVVSRADAERTSVPIGRAIPGAEVLLLSERGEPVPAGEVGHIHIRTRYRSLGYHRLGEATAESFVPNPLTGDPADIVYRTGDYGRLLPDGELEFLGRKDHQVKIGGVRVELGGVESILREHPAVADAAVVVAEEDTGVPYLCAFVELRDAAESRELRAHLLERLPVSAVPAMFVPMEELPRTVSGKIDRRALPAPTLRRDTADDTADDDYVAPRTPTEQALARIWTSLLPVDRVSVEDGFFEAGGSSLLVMELLSRLSEDLGVAIPLREFLARPTLEFLAELVERSILEDDEALDDVLALSETGSAR